MPRENRKRGKKHKKEQPQQEEQFHEPQHDPAHNDEQPDAEITSQDAPFGYVDPDVKAYFRTVDSQLKEWQDDFGDVEDGLDPKEDRRNFVVAALSEMAGKELQLATDPDCAAIIERLLHSMDDFLKRVFVDRLSGSLEQLMKHRFASHVCQTIFNMAGSTVSRETRGILPAHPDVESGQLRTLTTLVLDACEEVMAHTSSFVTHPFASHVLRAILVLLCPTIAPPASSADVLRSKKSAAFKAKQGPMKSIFNDQTHENTLACPKEFASMAKKVLHALKEGLGENEARAVAADKAGSPTLKLVVELEAHCGESDEAGSIMDHLLVGLVSASHDDEAQESVEPSDYLTTLLYDTTASHLLETLVARAPPKTFDLLWSTYFAGKLAKLGVHPVANFVVARAVDRLSAEQMQAAVEEMGAAGVWVKMRKTSRLGVLKALVDRAAVLQSCEAELVEAVCSAFDLTEDEDKPLIVQCVLRMKTPFEYRDARKRASKEEEHEDNSEDRPAKRRKHNHHDASDPLEPRIQGALLLQSLLHLREPHQRLVADSLLALEPSDLLDLAHHPVSSRVLDEAFSSPSHVLRKKLVGKYIGHFHTLADDRIGSRVAERAWAAADTYLKEKVARSLQEHEAFLQGSHFGRFFARAINLSLLARRPDNWRRSQAASRAPAPAHTPAAVSTPAEPEKEKKKRKRREDEIDELFAAGKGKGVTKDEEKKDVGWKRRKDDHTDSDPASAAVAEVDDAVLRAIRAAPSEGPHARKSGKKR